jgi:hypothetical protein
MTKEFKQWALANGLYIDRYARCEPSYIFALKAWKYRQSEIDALKQEIANLTSDLKDCQEQLIEGNP